MVALFEVIPIQYVSKKGIDFVYYYFKNIISSVIVQLALKYNR